MRGFPQNKQYCSRRRRGGFLPRCFVLLCCFLLLPLSPGSAAQRSAPLTSGGERNGVVRVRLSSLGDISSLNLTLTGPYTAQGRSVQQAETGASVTVKKNYGQLYITINGTAWNMGASFRLVRREVTSGLRIAQGRVSGNVYPADLSFSVSGSVLLVVASVYMEDYLYGVVPYEMGDSFALEALKAQAVAARTYTLRAMEAHKDSLWDVVDTTADQVYSGTPVNSDRCRQAVDETAGVAVRNGSAFTATYYTASNGGQTESIRNAWGTAGLSYLGIRDDPYDLMDPAAEKRSFTVSKAARQSNATLNSLMEKKAVSAFGAGAQITSVTDVSLTSPRYAAPSRLYTKMNVAVRYKIQNGDEQKGTLTFDIFKELEGPLGMNINSGANELWSVEASASGFTVTARRYGHGIGMSQRGALQMARQGMTYDQILAFYYDGCTRVQFAFSRSGDVSASALITPVPAAAASPAPTPSIGVSTLTATVSTASGGLNLRASADVAAQVLGVLPQGSKVTVLQKGSEWSRVVYEGTAGYVMTQFLSFPSALDGAAELTPVSGSQYARVNTQSGGLNLRAEPDSGSEILLVLPANALVSVLKQGAEWDQVRYENTTGYVMAKYLAQAEASPAPTAAPSVKTAQVTTASGSLYLREKGSGNAAILASIPRGALVTVLETGEWCRVQYGNQTGYVLGKYLTYVDASPTPAPADETDEHGLRTLETPRTARVAPSGGGRLNLRSAPSMDGKILLQLAEGTEVTVTALNDAWCAVTVGSVSGYCMRSFLDLNGYE